MPAVLTRLADAASDLAAAAEVWRAANVERGKPPDDARIARVAAKLADPAALVVVAVPAIPPAPCIGMALAEPGRDDDGTGDPLPDLCHVSMVFVDPGHWGNRIGEALLDRVATEAAHRGHARLQLWTGETNHRALRLYHRAGYRPTGRTKHLATDEPVLHLVRSLAGR